MADQKVTARVSLTSGVDPINDILPIVDVSAGASGSKKITINDLFTGWGMTPAGAAMAKSTSLQAQKSALGIGAFEFSLDITELAGSVPNSLDYIPTVNLPIGTRKLFEYNGYLVTYKLGLGFDASDNVPYSVAPDDFNPSTNAKKWLQDNSYINIFRCNSISIFNGARTVAIGADVSLTDSRFISADDFDGKISIARSSVVISGESTLQTVVPRMADVLYYYDASVTVPSHELILPTDSEARDGQSVIFKSNAEIFVFIVDAPGTTLDPDMPTTITAGQTVEFMYCKPYVTWLRIK